MHQSPRRGLRFLALLLMATFSAAGCSRAPAATPAPASAPATRPGEPWARLPPDQWPQLVLTNAATFEGHSPLRGASAFLMRAPDGEVLVGTAKHLIKSAGGVEPPLPIRQLDAALESWKVYPRTVPEVAVAAKGRAVTVNREGGHDWLLLHLADRAVSLPATVLTPRLRPAQVGETVYLVGVPYDDHSSLQNVYKGVVTARPSKNYFTYEFEPPVHISGFSGAPILDADGLLVGHGVARGQLKQRDGREVEFGGEDAATAVWAWRHRNDPPAP